MRKDLGKKLEVMEMYREGHDSLDRFFAAQTEYNQALIKEDAYWKQRAKIHWLWEGDINTKFFSTDPRQLGINLRRLSHFKTWMAAKPVAP